MDYKGLRGDSGYKRLQEDREGYRRLQWVPWVERGSKRLGWLRRVTSGYMKKH